MEPGSEIGRFAGNGPRFRHPLFSDVACGNQAARDADPCVQGDIGMRSQAFHRMQCCQTRPDGPIAIILVSLRVAEIDQDSVAQVLRNMTVKSACGVGDGLLERLDDFAIVLGIKSPGKGGRTYQVAEHHRQLPAFGLTPHPSLPRRQGRGRQGAAAGVCGGG